MNYKDLIGKSQKIINTQRQKFENNMPNLSDYSEEKRKEILQEYRKQNQEETTKKLDSILNDIEQNENTLKSEIDKIKYPFESQAITGSERIEAQITKQRAEALAMSKLNFQIIDYLESAIEKNETDFISNFANAIKLNSSIELDLLSEINSKLKEFNKKIGVDKKEIEMDIYKNLKSEAEIFQQIAGDNDPLLKMQTGNYSGELERLTKQLETV